MVDTIALRHQLFYFIGTFSPEFFRSNRKYCNCSLLAKQLKTKARLPTKFCSDLARFFRENTRSKSTKSMKNFPLNKFTLFEELLSYKILDKKNLRDIQTRRGDSMLNASQKCKKGRGDATDILTL